MVCPTTTPILDEALSEVLDPMIRTVTSKVPESSKSCVAEQEPDVPLTLEDSSSPNRKMHLKGPVPPVKMDVNVTSCPTKRLLLETVKLVVARTGSKKVKLSVLLAETIRVLIT
jgi:hypothetical protein